MKERSKVNRDFGKLVRMVREIQRIKRDAVAGTINRVDSYMPGLENGHREADLRDIEALAAALNMPSPIELMKKHWKAKLGELLISGTLEMRNVPIEQGADDDRRTGSGSHSVY